MALGYSHFRHQALFAYNSAMHDYFKRYKRYGDYALRRVFNDLLRQETSKLKVPCIYIPSSASHLNQRGFDPVVGLFQEVFKLFPALIKMETTQGQSEKNRQERLATPQFFQFNSHYQVLLEEPQLLLVDDIYTTGRTIFHAQDCLRQAGFRGQFQSLSLAR
ncbi:ComF family protein [Lactobacillus sp. DCY120]|uniref:ComF family protein n=1 Tax=Bombilactobacillus apium TaxID=2675299 RepID=A0A850R8G6_9LACO|nr:ComF family protein [Bombilactobacillus apium]NVY96825.1 ComF family protein [Bombilactobacillus apium]